MLFGNEEEPFIFTMDSVSGEMNISPIPTDLRLKNYQSCCRIGVDKVFFAGGCDADRIEVRKKAYIFDMKN